MEETSSEHQYPKKSQAYSAVAVLILANVMSFIDRQVPAMLVGPIKEDFNVSDSEIAFLIGFAFSATYAIIALPIGYAVDRMRRKVVLGSGIFLWSLMTMAAVFATSYKRLLGARMGVAVGEAVIAPVSVSVVSDSFPESQRGRAMGIVTTGVYIGIGISLIGGGYLIDYLTALGGLTLPIIGHVKPWQGAFMIAGLPGLFIALSAFMLSEPARKQIIKKSDRNIIGKDLINHIKNHRVTLFFMLVALLFMAMIFYSFSAWAPTMMVRTYGLSLSEVGMTLGIITIITSIFGAIAAGTAADKLTARGHKDGPVRAAMFACICALPAIALAPLMESIVACWILLAVYLFFISSYATLGLLSVGTVSNANVKGQMTAFFAILMMVSGIFGPQMTAGFTDFIFADESKLNWSVALTGAITLPIAIILFAFSLKHVRSSVDRIDD